MPTFDYATQAETFDYGTRPSYSLPAPEIPDVSLSDTSDLRVLRMRYDLQSRSFHRNFCSAPVSK
jgi:hypothetical protein